MKNRNLIIFTDSGDTIIDEGTQVFDDRGIVTTADFIPGADEVLKTLQEEGYRIALVADGNQFDQYEMTKSLLFVKLELDDLLFNLIHP